MENFGIALGFAALLGLVFTIFHFSLEKLATYQWFVNLKIERANLEISSGLFYSAGALLFTVLVWGVAPQITFIFGAISAIMTIIWRTWIAAVIVPMPSIIFYALTYSITSLTYWQIGVTFGTILICYLVSQLKPVRWKSMQLSFTHVIVVLISWLIYGLIESKINDNLTQEITLGLGALTLVCAVVVSALIGWVVSANLLARSTTYAFTNYYRYAVAEVIIQKQITTERPQFAIYALFEFLTPENNKNSLENYLTETYSTLKTINEKITVFSITQNLFGAFLPMQSNLKNGTSPSKKQLCNEFEKAVSLIPAVNNRAFGYAIYNLDSASLDELERYAMRALKQSKTRQVAVTKYTYAADQSNMRDLTQINAMDETLKLDNYEITFNHVMSASSAAQKLSIMRIENIAEFESDEALQTYLELNNWTETFDRYYAIVALERLSTRPDSQIIVNYEPLNKRLIDFTDLAARIKSFNVKESQIIFAVKPKNMAILSQNLKAATKQNLKIALINPPKILAKQFPSAFVLTPGTKKGVQIQYNNNVIITNLDTPQLVLEYQKKPAWGKAGRALDEASQPN